MVTSFRSRLFWVSALIVGTVLLAMVGIGWSSVLNFQIERLDDRMCMEARRMHGPDFSADGGEWETNDVLTKLRLGSPDQLMLRLEPATHPARVQAEQRTTDINLDALAWEAPRAASDAPSHSDCSFASFQMNHRDWRAASVSTQDGRSFVAADLSATRADLQSALQRALFIMVPVALALTALGAWLLSSVTMRPVNRLRDAMKKLTQKDLNHRLSTDGEDREFAALIDVYNVMLARLESGFLQASRFSADAAHELKTPLTILQGRIEQAVQKSDNRDIQVDLIGLLDEVGRLATITRKLLLLSQADAGRLALQMMPIDITAMLHDLVLDASMLMADHSVLSQIDTGLVIRADALLLQQVLNNLISNAVRYSAPDGVVTVRGTTVDGGVQIIFTNACLAVSAQSRARFFDRFYRGDAARIGRADGYGLGLSLAREIARAHGGEIALLPTAPECVSVRLWLPH